MGALIRNVLLFGIGSILQRAMMLLLLPLYTRYLTPADYGITGVLSVVALVGGTITLCGLTNGVGRYYHYHEQEGTTRAAVVWSPLVWVTVFSLALLLPAICFAAPLAAWILHDAGLAYLLQLTLAGVLFANWAAIGLGVLVFQERAGTVNILNLATVAVGTLAGLGLVVHLGRGVTGMVEAGVLTSALMALPTLGLALAGLRPAFDAPLLRKQLAFSFPLVLAAAFFLVIDSSDRYLLNLFLPLSEVGLYNIGYTLALAMLVLVGGFSSAWPPYYHRHNQQGEGQAICNQVLQAYLLAGSAVLVALAAGAPLLLQLFTDARYHGAYTVVPWVALAYLLKGPYLIFLMGVLMKDKARWQLYLEGVAMAANLAGNVLLIPLLGRDAAALTTLLSYGIMAFGSLWMVSRVNPIPGLARGFFFGVLALDLVVCAAVPALMRAGVAPILIALGICAAALPPLGWLGRNVIKGFR